MTMRAECATTGAGKPVNPPSGSACPPWIELMFMVDCRAPGGTTGMAVRFCASAG